MSYLKSIIYLHRAPSSDEDQYGQRDMVAGIRRVKHELFKVCHLPTSRAIIARGRQYGNCVYGRAAGSLHEEKHKAYVKSL